MDGLSSNPGVTEAAAPSIPAGQGPPAGGPLDAKTRILNSRSRQRADTKERIFETALREFRDVGFASAQIDRIAKNAGVARGTFYFHFPTKDDVMLELARRINRRGVERLSLMVESDPDLRSFLRGFIDILIDEFGRISDAGLNAELLALYIRRPYDLRDPIHNAPVINEELVGHLRRLSLRQAPPFKMDPERLAVVVMSSLFGILARVPRDAGVREICHSLIDLVVDGLRAES